MDLNDMYSQNAVRLLLKTKFPIYRQENKLTFYLHFPVGNLNVSCR